MSICDLTDMEHSGPHLDNCNWGPKAWNENERDCQKTTWTASLCEHCWFEKNDRAPSRSVTPEPQICTNCGVATRSGIFTRISPEEQVYKRWVDK